MVSLMEARRLIAGISAGKILFGLGVAFAIKAISDKIRKDDAPETEDNEEDEE